MKRKVVIHQIRLPYYREPLFEILRDKCAHEGIDIHLVYGQPSKRELCKQDQGELKWANKVHNFYFSIAGSDLVYQPSIKEEFSADLVILQQENRIISNYPYFFSRKNKPRIALWGHGKNFQSTYKNTLKERWKKLVSCKVDWWFAYTSSSADVVIHDIGYPEERVTVLNNSIDTSSFQKDLESINEIDKKRFRKKLGADDKDKIGIYCGSLYSEKKLDILFKSCEVVKREISRFYLVVLGDGPDHELVRKWEKKHDWIYWAGATRGYDKAVWFSISDVMLNPGLVGLHILDSFVSGLPMISTIDAKHGPEICYLQSGKNGLLVGSTVDEYSSAIIKLINDENKLCELSRQARIDGKKYSIESMASNFHQGIIQCLMAPPYR